jgi:hypothetical protein
MPKRYRTKAKEVDVTRYGKEDWPPWFQQAVAYGHIKIMSPLSCHVVISKDVIAIAGVGDYVFRVKKHSGYDYGTCDWQTFEDMFEEIPNQEGVQQCHV